MTPLQYAALYRDNLLNDVIPFWVKHSVDETYGGYYTCLDRTGNVYDTDKFVWLQNRQVWCFSMLYNQVNADKAWLDLALNGERFLSKYGRAESGDWYFSLTREGKPLTQPFNIFSDCFAAMAYAQLFRATGRDEHAAIAKTTFLNILARQHDPKGKYSKAYPGTRPLRNFALPMILTNLVLEMESILDKELVDRVVEQGTDTVLNTFYKPDMGVVLEHVGAHGEFVDSFEGRQLNPGHGLEAMWFIMDIGVKKGDMKLIRKAVDISLQLLELGWDRQHGGIFYFLDVKGYPPQQLEWDQKLWWVHVEALVNVLKGWLHTGDKRCREWFEKLHEYTWKRFPDPEYGEWFGYLDRRGEVLLPLKGGKWKGCFHVPRGLYQCWKTLEQINTTI